MESHVLERPLQHIDRAPPAPLHDEHLVHLDDALGVGLVDRGMDGLDLLGPGHLNLEPAIRLGGGLLAEVSGGASVLVAINARHSGEVELVPKRGRHDARMHVGAHQQRLPITDHAIEVVTIQRLVQWVFEVAAEQDRAPSVASSPGESVEDHLRRPFSTEVEAELVEPGRREVGVCVAERRYQRAAVEIDGAFGARRLATADVRDRVPADQDPFGRLAGNSRAYGSAGEEGARHPPNLSRSAGSLFTRSSARRA